jgi:DNA-binding NarL/FixJ family response regulator
VRLLIADDHPLFRMGLRAALERNGFTILGEASDGEEAVQLGLQLQPEAIILDVRMPKQDGIAAARTLRNQGYRGLIALLTTFNEPALVHQAASIGVDAYWSKELHPNALALKLRNLKDGTEPGLLPPQLPKLSQREQEVLGHLAQGLSTKEIARELKLSPETIKDHLMRLYDKLDAHNKVEALERARALGFI